MLSFGVGGAMTYWKLISLFKLFFSLFYCESISLLSDTAYATQLTMFHMDTPENQEKTGSGNVKIVTISLSFSTILKKNERKTTHMNIRIKLK